MSLIFILTLLVMFNKKNFILEMWFSNLLLLFHFTPFYHSTILNTSMGHPVDFTRICKRAVRMAVYLNFALYYMRRANIIAEGQKCHCARSS